MKKTHTVEVRIEESRNASKVVGAKDVIFLGLDDMKLKEEIYRPEVAKTLKNLIKKHKPTKIFTHSSDDNLYADHVAVNEIVFKAIQDMKKDGSFDTIVATHSIYITKPAF